MMLQPPCFTAATASDEQSLVVIAVFSTSLNVDAKWPVICLLLYSASMEAVIDVTELLLASSPIAADF